MTALLIESLGWQVQIAASGADAQQAYAATQAELIAARQARAEARAILSRQAAADGDADHQP